MFYGTEFLSLDAKGRLSMPGRHRLAFEGEANKDVTVTRHLHRCLLIYQRPAWEKFRDDTVIPLQDQWLKRLFLGSAMDVKLDATFRLLVSPELRVAAGLVREVKLIGMGDHFELWDKATHDAEEAAALASSETARALQGISF